MHDEVKEIISKRISSRFQKNLKIIPIEVDKHLIDEVEGVEKKAILLPDILTAGDVAKYLHIGRSNAYRLLSDGDIPSFRVGQRSLRTTRDALQDYINQRCSQQH